MTHQLLSFIQIDQRSKTPISEQIIQQIKDYIHQHFLTTDVSFISKEDFLYHFKTTEHVYREVISELLKFEYLIKKNDQYYFSQSPALKYILPKPFGRRAYTQNENEDLVEVILKKEIIPTPEKLSTLFLNASHVLLIEKHFFKFDQLKATSTIYTQVSHMDNIDLIIEPSDVYQRTIRLDSKNKQLNTLFKLNDMVFIKGQYQIKRKSLCVEYGEVITIAEYSFKRKQFQLDTIIDF